MCKDRIIEIASEFGFKLLGECVHESNTELVFGDSPTGVTHKVYLCPESGVIVMMDVKHDGFKNKIHLECARYQ